MQIKQNDLPEKKSMNNTPKPYQKDEEMKQEQQESKQNILPINNANNGADDTQSPQYLPKNKKTVIKWLYTHFNTKNKLKALKKNPLFGQTNKDPNQESSCCDDNESQQKSQRDQSEQLEGTKEKKDEKNQSHKEDKQDDKSNNQEKQFTPYETKEEPSVNVFD